MEVIPNDDASAKAWLNGLFAIHREWDGLTLTQMFPPESKGKRLMYLVGTELTSLRDQIAHSIMYTGELSLSADDLVQIQRVIGPTPHARRAVRAVESLFAETNVSCSEPRSSEIPFRNW